MVKFIRNHQHKKDNLSYNKVTLSYSYEAERAMKWLSPDDWEAIDVLVRNYLGMVINRQVGANIAKMC